ncbi:MAG: RNA methyltransferase [Bacteroidota bacterium]|nr:RNA methyltransferase [Bacteroidota bacterium]
MHLHSVDSIEIPELGPYRTLRARTQHWQRDVFVAESAKAVRALLDSEIRVLSLLLNEEWLRTLNADLAAPRFADTAVYVASDSMLEGIVGFPLHQKLLALAAIPENPPLEALRGDREGVGLHVALEGLADAENMGMILRNCAAFGVDGVLVGPDSTSPYLRRSVRVSLGNVFSLRIHRAENLHTALKTCRDRFGWHVVGTTPRSGSPALADRVREGREVCLLFGSEAEGLTPEALALCDEYFSIPMYGGVDSINVANAVAVSLYEATRRGA